MLTCRVRSKGVAFHFASFLPRSAALKVAQHQVRLAQTQAAPRMQAALVGLDDALSDQIAWLENAAEDDKAEAEESGEAEREREAWFPRAA